MDHYLRKQDEEQKRWFLTVMGMLWTREQALALVQESVGAASGEPPSEFFMPHAAWANPLALKGLLQAFGIPIPDSDDDPPVPGAKRVQQIGPPEELLRPNAQPQRRRRSKAEEEHQKAVEQVFQGKDEVSIPLASIDPKQVKNLMGFSLEDLQGRFPYLLTGWAGGKTKE